mmetsp:Transcript_15424/g.27296  ORF Transcript_15424/g.27296 Transcript_15424/m.27296 type:complete len:97 (-) Transcript_15424:315-605(-)
MRGPFRGASAIALPIVLAVAMTPGSSDGHNTEKTRWPECVGMDGHECKAVIESERPDLQVSVGPDDGMYTCDFVETRVRIKVNSETGLVTHTPTTG